MKTHEIDSEDDAVWSYEWDGKFICLTTKELANVMKNLYSTPEEYFNSFDEKDTPGELSDVIYTNGSDLSKMSFENVLDVLYETHDGENNIYAIDDSSYKMSKYFNRYLRKV